MALGKQAKTLSKGQVDALLSYVARTRHPIRNRVIVLLSIRAGLRAKEIASLTWDMVTNSEGSIGTAIHLQDKASKGKSGRIIPMNSQLRIALLELKGDPIRRSPVVLRGHDREVYQDISPGHRELTSPLVCGVGIQRVLKPFWTSDVHHQRCTKDLDCRWIVKRRADAGGAFELSTTQRDIEANGDAQRRIVEVI